MVCDLGGFVASCFKRGIEFLHIPTTLLAMVDASLGGKTGVNLGHLKNQVGVFAQPVGIYTDVRFLETLPERELRAGLAEMAKHGLIRDRAHWEEVAAVDPAEIGQLDEAIVRSIAIKQAVVEEDPYEQGLRKILNFGHTVGHAVEALFMTAEKPLLHGEAVAIGMVAEAWLSHKVCGLPLEDAEAIAHWVGRTFDPVEIPADDLEYLQQLITHDKKNHQGTVLYVLLESIGNAVYNKEVPDEMLADALNFYHLAAH